MNNGNILYGKVRKEGKGRRDDNGRIFIRRGDTIFQIQWADGAID